MKVSLIQNKIYWEDRSSNFLHFGKLIRSIKSKTDLIVLPEMFTTGFTMDPKRFAEEYGSTLLWMQDMAKIKNACITGSVAVKEKGKYYNRLYFVQPNGKYQSYDKRHLFRMAGEDKHYKAGRAKTIVKTGDWNICPMICYDLRFPVWSRNSTKQKKKNGQAEYEYDVLIYVANWPKIRSYPWKQLLMARAIENQCYVIGVNRVGKDGKGIDHSGDSLVIDPKGKVIGKLKPGSKGFIHVELDKVSLEEFRRNFPAGMDADLFQIKV